MSGFRILNAQYETSVAKSADVSATPLPEVAFVGRSNVGKSTLLNALVGQKSLARTSKTPGRTRMLNYFHVELERMAEPPARFDSYFVDIPGYGYAQVGKRERDAWKRLVESYLFGESRLVALVLLIDARRGPKEEECMLAEIDIAGSVLPVLTKTDKLNQKETAAARKRAASAFGLHAQDFFETGITGGKARGIERLRAAISELVYHEHLIDQAPE